MRKTKLFLVGCLLSLGFAPGAYAQQDDRMLQILKDELNKEMEELQKQEVPPYHMNFRMMDEKNVNIAASFGVLQGVSESHTRSLVPQIRVGSMELDNFKYNLMGSPTTTRTESSRAFLPVDDDTAEEAIRQAIWAESESRYEFAVNMYQQSKTKSTVSVADEDKAPCFSEAPVEKYYEAPLPEELTTIDTEAWGERLKEVSAVFKEWPELQQGSASIQFEVKRTYFVNTEGTEVVQNRVAARVMLSATMKADDGMELPLNREIEHGAKDVILRNHFIDFLVGKVSRVGERHVVPLLQLREPFPKHIIRHQNFHASIRFIICRTKIQMNWRLMLIFAQT